MSNAKGKRILSIVCTVVSGAALIGSIVAPSIHPAVLGADNPVLRSLRATNAGLQAFSDAREKENRGKIAFYRRQTWSEQGFKLWADTNVKNGGWILNDLGPADLAHVKGRRYAMQKPNATANDWPGIATLLQTMESTPCVSVVSATLTVGEGIVGSQKFSQCLFVGVFYFNGDDAKAD
jgi:hypothetical protein